MIIFTISNRDIFVRALKPHTEIANEGIADYSLDEFWLIAFDKDEFLHVAIRISTLCTVGALFACDHQGITVLNLHELLNHLKLTRDDEDCISLLACKRDNECHILHQKVGLLNEFRHLIMPLFKVRVDEIYAVRNLQQYEYQVVLGMPTEDFIDRLLTWVLTEDNRVLVAITYQQVEFSADIWTCALPKGLEEGDCIIGGVGEDDRVEFEISLLHVFKFLGLARMSSRVWILYSDDAPPMLNFPLGAIGNILFYFMPNCFTK